MKAFASAPGALQVVIAMNLAGSKDGGESLLKAVDEGKASARLLQERGVSLRLEQVGVADLKERLSTLLKGLPPGPEGSLLKLGASELNLRINKFAMEILGPYSQMEFKAPHALDQGKWLYRMLASRALTIAGGTSEIQHNIIGGRVLGLPRG